MIWALVIVAIIVVGGLLLVALYNRLVQQRNRVDNAWAQIEVQLKRRWDLIPNLVESVKGYARTSAARRGRDEARRAQNAKSPAESAQAEGDPRRCARTALRRRGGVPGAAGRRELPQLQSELAETENKVAVSRQVYNDTVLTYNNTVQTFLDLVVAGPFGFSIREFFEVEDEAQREAPKVDF